jgi:quercetin dioxygenase-like cupin family protein
MRTDMVRMAVAGLALCALTGTAAAGETKTAYQPKVQVDRLLAGPTKTVVGEDVRYPGGVPAEITAAVVTLPPGKTTGWHRHGVPLFGYILSGALEVDYGDKGVRTYAAGDGLMEAMDQRHQGVNRGAEPVRILVVYMGAEGLKNVLPD